MAKESKRKKFIINGVEFTSARMFVQTQTEYCFSQYNSFRSQTGVAICSQETADAFLKWMEEGNFNSKMNKISPITHKGKVYKKLGPLLLALDSNINQYISYTNNKGKYIRAQEDIQDYIAFVNEPKKNKPIKIMYNNVEYKSLKKLINALGYSVSQYAWFRKKTGKNIRRAKDIKSFLEFMLVDGRLKENRKIG